MSKQFFIDVKGNVKGELTAAIHIMAEEHWMKVKGL